MKLISGRINWWEGYGNLPTFYLKVEGKPEHDNLRYNLVDVGRGQSLLWAEKDGLADFFHHTPHDESGYGGSIFKVTLIDGTERTFRGPWSSRAGLVNLATGKDLVDVTFEQERYSLQCGCVTLEWLRHQLDMVVIDKYTQRFWGTQPEVENVFPEGSRPTLVRALDKGDIRWDPAVLYPDGTKWVKHEHDCTWVRASEVVLYGKNKYDEAKREWYGVEPFHLYPDELQG